MGSYTGTVPSFLAGEIPDADKFLEITNYMTASTSAWTTYTPTLANLTLGSGTVVASYRRLGQTLWIRFKFTLGAGSAVGSSPTFSLPSGMTAIASLDVCGDFQFQDTGTASRRGQGVLSSTTTIGIFNFSTTGVLQVTNSTTPHTWASTDVIFFTSYPIELV